MNKIGKCKMYVNGEWLDAKDGEVIEVTNPATGDLLGTVPKGKSEDAVLALNAAQAAFKQWRLTPAVERAGYIWKLIELTKQNREELARCITMEQGKVIGEARGEVDSTTMFMEYGAESARRVEGDIFPSQNRDEQIWIEKVPHGVVVGIVPWNYPLSLSGRKFANALVCGNTFVLKPPSITPLTVMKFAELVDKAGFPKGVFNIVSGTGSEMGSELASNPISKLVSLTGSTSAGVHLFHEAADEIKILRLELGGKAPFIVMDDANVDDAVDAGITARFSNCGQICVCNERMFIHEKIYDEFINKYIKKAAAIKVGDPLDESMQMGPNVSGEEQEKILGMVERAVAAGGKLLLGGHRLTGPAYDAGNFMEPTVIEVYDNKMEIMQEEIFGPVSPVLKVSSFDQALDYANDCKYGLSAYVFTKNVKNLMRCTQELEFGELYLNRTAGEQVNGFHTGLKQSGVGGEDGKYGLAAYTAPKTVYMNYSNL